MSQTLIRKALEKRLAAMSPALATAFENAAYTPVQGTPYQKANLLPATPDNIVHGAATWFERGIFQVTLCYPTGTGPAAADARAELVRAQFKRGTTMTEGAVNVLIVATPRIAPALVEGDRYCIPVSAAYQAQLIA
jgi:hypothetical protein